MTRFQLIFTGVLIALGVAGVIVFATAKNKNQDALPNVVLWGTLPTEKVSKFITDISLAKKGMLNVSYVEKNGQTFETELIEALARGGGPDMVLLPQDLILRQRDKFYITPYENFSERTFRDSFIEGAELYLTLEGTIAFPFSVDPMVMYWNRDLFTSADVALPPTAWTDFFNLVPQLTQKDERGNITQSLVAFGEVRNVTHAKDIISMLALQAGTPIVQKNGVGTLTSVFNTRTDLLVPAEQAVSFFTEFSNPVKSSYSWNRSLMNDRSAFLAGKLALYFGYASEVESLRNANPNLNFDVALVPQTTTATNTGKRLTFGKMTGIALLKTSRNLLTAYSFASILTAKDAQQMWVDASGYPPVRRDLIVTLPGDAYKAVFYRSALISKAWLDPYREVSADIFSRLIENITSGRQRVSESVNSAHVELSRLIR